MRLLAALCLFASIQSSAQEACSNIVQSAPADQIAPFGRALDKVLTAEEELSCRADAKHTVGSVSSSFDVQAGPITIRKALSGSLSASLWKQSGQIKAFEIQAQIEGLSYNLFTIDPQFFPELYTAAFNQGIEGLETRARGGALQDEAIAQIYLQNLPEMRKRLEPLIRAEAHKLGWHTLQDRSSAEPGGQSRLEQSVEETFQTKVAELRSLPPTLDVAAHPLAKAIYRNHKELLSRSQNVRTTQQKLDFILDYVTETTASALALTAAGQPVLRLKPGVPVAVAERKVRTAFSLVSASQLVAAILSDPKKRDAFADLEGLHPLVSVANRENPALGAHERLKNIAYTTAEIRALSNAIGTGGGFRLERDSGRPVWTDIESPTIGMVLQLRGSACGNQLCFSGESRLTLRAKKLVSDTAYDLAQEPRPGERFSEADQLLQAAFRKAGMSVPSARAFRGCIEATAQTSSVLFQGLLDGFMRGASAFEDLIRNGKRIQAQGHGVQIRASTGSSTSSMLALQRSVQERPMRNDSRETFAENFGRALLQGLEEFSEMDLVAELDREIVRREQAVRVTNDPR